MMLVCCQFSGVTEVYIRLDHKKIFISVSGAFFGGGLLPRDSTIVTIKDKLEFW